jgi:hypothetical protein
VPQQSTQSKANSTAVKTICKFVTGLTRVLVLAVYEVINETIAKFGVSVDSSWQRKGFLICLVL